MVTIHNNTSRLKQICGTLGDNSGVNCFHFVYADHRKSENDNAGITEKNLENGIFTRKQTAYQVKKISRGCQQL